HAGNNPDETGARQIPIHQSASFVFKNAQQAADLFALKEVGYIYSRLTNPTIGALQERMAALESGVGAIACASGHAAQLTAFHNLLQSGDEFIAAKKLYGGSINQFKNSFKQYGWNVKFVDVDNLDDIKAAINSKTKFIFAESLSNPQGAVTDIKKVADLAHDNGIPLIIDNTIATAALVKPIEHGADIVINSTTKFLTGNGSTVGGVIIDSGKFDWSQNDKFPLLCEPDPSYHGLKFHEACGELAFTFRAIAVGLRDLGAVMAPMNAFLTMLGLETLPLRMQRHCTNALEVAKFLSSHSKVDWVKYPGLDDNDYNKLAKQYLQGGFGAVFTFGVKGGLEAGKKIVDSCKLFSHVANVGDSRSLIIHPSSTTHSQLSEEEKILSSATDDVLRVSIGIEDASDIISDLNQALESL
ncbi:O-acetylhomoserine aminocarboxypropyltransferase/cysteine synthase, partial [Rickettsiales bacterium]|nr:O-acetylhomoserine aminocarboxypropyltransferase/cysteine synthase [Rickettsiales bacterium]